MSDLDIREKLGVVPLGETIEWVKMLFYGEPGIGKTWLTGTCLDHEELRPALFIDIDGGLATLRHRRDVDPIPLKSVKEFVDKINMLYNDTSGYYKTLIVDNLSELGKRDMQEVMRQMLIQHPERDPDVASKREWGISNEHVRRIVRACKDLPMHVIFTAHSRTLEQESGPDVTGPSLPGQLRNEIPGFLDVVGYMYMAWENNQEVRRTQFQKTRRVNAKDRYNALGSYLDNVSMPLLWELIQNGEVDAGTSST